MRKLAILVLVAMMAAVVLGATGCCCVPCGDLGGLFGSTTMVTSPGDFSDIPPYPGSQRLNEVAIPGIIKTIFEQASGGGKFDVKGYGTRDAPDRVGAFYDKNMPENAWTAATSPSESSVSDTGYMGYFTKGEDIVAMIYAVEDDETDETMIIIMRLVVPESQ